MHTPKSDFVNTLMERGFVHQAAHLEELDALADREVVTGYIGFDCTAKSLHVGSLVPIMMLHWLQKTGHRPIAVMGGGTTQVGDPSGKDETRKLLSADEIAANKRGIQKVFSRFLAFGDGPTDAMMVDNAEWLADLNWLGALREIGRHFSVNRMQTMDSVRLRMEGDRELSFLEFNYMILQAYDFVVLNRRYGCRLQMGGSDQWGNIMMGLDLGRRMGTEQLFAVTTPLLSTASGAKMGKSVDGAVWLEPDMLPTFKYWQFWRNVDDADVSRFLKLFTVMHLEEVQRLSALQGSEINEAKKILATEATALVHGREAAVQAAETSRLTFEEGVVADDLPTVQISKSDFARGLGVLDAFAHSGLVTSKSEARRQIRARALKVNDKLVDDEAALLTDDALSNGVVKLSFGRKKNVLLRAV
jgi:tyrosyl-tRNA synthetase